MIYPVTTPGAFLATCEGRTLKVKYQAVMVVGMSTVDTLYMCCSLFIMNRIGGVRGKQAYTTDLTRLHRVPLRCKAIMQELAQGQTIPGQSLLRIPQLLLNSVLVQRGVG